MRFRHHLLIATLLLAAPLSFAATERGVMVRVAQIYLSPDTSSPRIATIDRGREVAVIEKSRDWLHVLATLSEPTELSEGRDISGWILDKGVVRAATPNGDKVLVGEAGASDQEASRRGGRKGADKDALRLYYRAAEYFPQSPVAGEALYRAADIRWQIDRADMFGRPSGRGAPSSRLYGIDEDLMKQVVKKFPHTKWADLAAYDMLDNKLCGDWQGESKCPEKEARFTRNTPTSIPSRRSPPRPGTTPPTAALPSSSSTRTTASRTASATPKPRPLPWPSASSPIFHKATGPTALKLCCINWTRESPPTGLQ